jgi:hypothetical protein
MVGTNDWGSALETLANFTTWLGNQIDSIHTADPTAPVYLVKPIHRTSPPEASNPGGVGYGTLADYAGAIDTVASTRSYCTVFNGQTWLPGNPSGGDGIHMDDTNADTFYAAANAALVAIRAPGFA